MTSAAYIIAEGFGAERAVCDALAEAVAGYMLSYWFDQEQPEYVAMRAALDAYHAHREVWP